MTFPTMTLRSQPVSTGGSPAASTVPIGVVGLGAMELPVAATVRVAMRRTTVDHIAALYEPREH